MAGRYQPLHPQDIAQLIRDHPLAFVVSGWSGSPTATSLPLLAETDADGRVVSLLGHFARANPQLRSLKQDPRALILFQGPQGYISPEGLSNRDWAPTWNYATLQFETEIMLVPEANDDALVRLIATMEEGRDPPWTQAEMGARYEKLARHVVAFRATVRSARAIFKLGQDERRETFGEIMNWLQDSPLRQLMAVQNPGAHDIG